MFIAGLFTIAKAWRQPKCPLTDEWIKKMWHIYPMDYYSVIQRNETTAPVAAWMNLGISTLSASQGRQTPCDVTYAWDLK